MGRDGYRLVAGQFIEGQAIVNHSTIRFRNTEETTWSDARKSINRKSNKPSVNVCRIKVLWLTFTNVVYLKFRTSVSFIEATKRLIFC